MGFDVKNTTFSAIAGWLCPHSCCGCGELGELLCGCCKKDLILGSMNCCLYCKQPKNSCERCHFCGLEPSYMVGWRDETIGKLVYELKYDSKLELAGILAETLDAILPELSGPVSVVPLPTIQKHVRERGLNHTKIIGRKLAKRRGWRMEEILARDKNTVQVGTDNITRKIQASGAYKITGKIAPEKTYILFDDVWTTGASMRAAAKKLREAGALKIILAVLAVSRIGDN